MTCSENNKIVVCGIMERPIKAEERPFFLSILQASWDVYTSLLILGMLTVVPDPQKIPILAAMFISYSPHVFEFPRSFARTFYSGAEVANQMQDESRKHESKSNPRVWLACFSALVVALFAELKKMKYTARRSFCINGCPFSPRNHGFYLVGSESPIHIDMEKAIKKEPSRWKVRREKF